MNATGRFNIQKLNIQIVIKFMNCMLITRMKIFLTMKQVLRFDMLKILKMIHDIFVLRLPCLRRTMKFKFFLERYAREIFAKAV